MSRQKEGGRCITSSDALTRKRRFEYEVSGLV